MTGYIKLETIGKMGEMISHLEQQNTQLQKKLDIAVKALNFYKKDVCGEPYISSIAKKALKEIDLVGTSAKEEG